MMMTIETTLVVSRCLDGGGGGPIWGRFDLERKIIVFLRIGLLENIFTTIQVKTTKTKTTMKLKNKKN